MSVEKAGVETLGEKKLLFIKVEAAILEKLAGKPYIEQMKVLLETVREAKNGEGATEEIVKACEHSEKLIIWEMNRVNAELN